MANRNSGSQDLGFSSREKNYCAGRRPLTDCSKTISYGKAKEVSNQGFGS
jgi:hypothetical protein